MSIISRIACRAESAMNSLIAKSAWYNETLQFEGCQRILSNREFNYDIANLGSSSAYHAFDNKSSCVKWLNLATPRQCLKADREMIKNYFSYMHEGAVILIPLCLFSALVGEDEELSDKYYVLLHNESIPHFSWKKKLQVLEWYNNPLKLFPCYSLVYEVLRRFKLRKRHLTEKQFEEDAERWIRDWKHEFSIVDFSRQLSLKNKDSYESASKILQDILLFCNSRGFKPILVLPPISTFLSKRFEEEVRGIMVSEFVKQSNIIEAPFLNYLDDVQFADSGYYQNSYYLNKKGASEFTKRVISDLYKMGYLS